MQEIERHEDAWPFKAPVSKEEVPDYYDVIKVGGNSEMEAGAGSCAGSWASLLAGVRGKMRTGTGSFSVLEGDG